MINLNSIPLSYLCISILLSGFTFFALIKFIYIFHKTGRYEVLPFIFLGAGAFLYTASDAAALIYYINTSDYQTARIFIITRELSSMSFLIIIPYQAGQALVLNQYLKRINRLLLHCGILTTFVITVTAFFNPGLFIGEPGFNMPVSFREIVAIRKTELLFLLKTALLVIYLAYALFVFLFSNIFSRVTYPVSKILTGLFILAYIVLSGFYSLIFFNEGSGYVSFYYPHISTGIAAFLLFYSLGLVDIFINYTSQLIKVRNDLKQILYEDSLLGISNRNGFINDLNMKMSDMNINSRNSSLIFLDIDDFQHINESFGEKAGDEILKLLSLRLIDLFSSTGKLYRIGGDEFALMLKDMYTEDDSITIANRIIKSLRNPFPVFGASYLITASLGIILVPRDGSDPETIINNAYSVIRDAKQTKNTYRLFSKDIIDNSSKKVSVVNLLRASIAADQFTMYYQPVVDSDEKLIYAESLLRCTNPDRSIGGPGEFIPLLEKAGIMRDVDDMVIRKVFHDIEMNIRDRFKISINLSSSQLVDPAYSDFLSEFAVQQGIRPEQIILEVIENTLIENFAKGRTSLLRLKENGFKIAIDDFGKGFSSLSYLSELPVDILKIDMAFVQQVPGDPKKEAIAAHIMELAHSLDLNVVAEGFETWEQFEFFRLLGCDNFQGYYFSPPLPLDKLLLKYGLL